MTWVQKGFVVISDTEVEIGPLFHCFDPAQWTCDHYVETHQNLPEHLRKNIRVVPAELKFES